MNDKKTITVEIPILDKVDQMKVVETFTEEQLWYVCALAKAFEKIQSNWNSLREWLKNKIDNFQDDVSEPILHEQMTMRVIYEYMENLDKMNELEGKDKE